MGQMNGGKNAQLFIKLCALSYQIKIRLQLKNTISARTYKILTIKRIFGYISVFPCYVGRLRWQMFVSYTKH